jgi:hypothetical protein
MNMVFRPPDPKCLAPDGTACPGQIGMEGGLNELVDPRLAVLGAENEVQQNPR